MKTNLKKSVLSVAFMAAIFSICLSVNANAATIHSTALSDTGKMSKMSKMSKPSKMKAKKMDKMSKMSKDSSKMSKM